MYFVHVASELAPVAKVGGLGDVLYGLSKKSSSDRDILSKLSSPNTIASITTR